MPKHIIYMKLILYVPISNKLNRHISKTRFVIKDYLFMIRKECFYSYLDRGKNMDPSINTEPDSRIYQHVDNSPVL